jgi:uncharacterized iron-regulated protein
MARISRRADRNRGKPAIGFCPFGPDGVAAAPRPRHLAGMIRTIARAFAAATALLLAVPAPAADPPRFEAPLHRDHPLVGEIRAAADGAALTPGELAARLADARFVLLGERHDNPDHHALQAWILRALADAGRRPAVAFEMLERSQQDALDAYRDSHPGDAEGLGPALDWEARGWPAWAQYQPIAEAALAHELPLVAADADRATIQAVGRQGYGALHDGRAGALGLATPLPEAQQAALIEELKVAHCDMLPEAALAPMAKVQRLRDAVMADSLIRAAKRADGTVLITGGGHARADRGVPWYLRARLEAPTVATIRFFQVRPGQHDWRAYLPETPGSDRAAFDYVWFTPAVEHGDPCAEFAEQMKRHGEQRARENAEDGADE